MAKRRQRGSIRQRGRSYMVEVFAGRDPLTKRKLYLRESTTDEREAEKIRTRLLAQVDAQKHSKTRATFRVAMDKWLRTHDVEETTRASYEQYARVHLYPAFGDQLVGRVTTQLLEEFYAELRSCSARCGGRPFVEHRASESHECRVVKHKRPPGRPPAVGYPTHDCSEAARSSSVGPTCARRRRRPRSAASTSRSAACWAQRCAGVGSPTTQP